jgi:hypothetical protein
MRRGDHDVRGKNLAAEAHRAYRALAIWSGMREYRYGESKNHGRFLRVYRRTHQERLVQFVRFTKKGWMKNLPAKAPSFVLKISKCNNLLSRPIPGALSFSSSGGIADAFAKA